MISKEFLYQLAIITKIWIVGSVLNAFFGSLIGAIFIGGFLAGEGAIVYFGFLLILGLIYMLPVFVGVLIFLNRSLQKHKSGKWIRNGTYFLATGMAFFACLIFAFLNPIYREVKTFVTVVGSTELSIILSLSIHSGTLKELSMKRRLSNEMMKMEVGS